MGFTELWENYGGCDQSISDSISDSIEQSRNRSVNQLINQSIEEQILHNQAIDQWMN